MRMRIPCALLVAFCTLPAVSRTVETLSNGWTCDGEPVGIPHTWNAVDGCDGEGDFGDVWSSAALTTSYLRTRKTYRRALEAAEPGRRYFIRCEGASTKAVVRVNGREIGRHACGYTAFACEATAAMRTDGPNELEIEVGNTWDPHILPFFGDFTVQGGLYRRVSLIETGAVCIDPLRYGGSGLRIWPDAKTGKVKVDVAVNGAPDETREYDFGKPELWSPENPRLYSVTVRLAGGDEVTERFGFRTAEFRKDGFYLNGVRRRFRGVNRHQDREGKGYAVSAEDEREDVRIIKSMGADSVRTCHYPQSRDYLDACDEAGLMVWFEAANVNYMTFDDEFRSNLLTQVREIVAQNANHPSVVLWGLFNELEFGADRKPTMQPEKVIDFLTAERDEFHRLDPTRKTVAASNNPDYRPMNLVSDVAGFNLYPGWYGWKPWYELDPRSAAECFRKVAPTIPGRQGFILSEYGAGGCAAQHADVMSARPASDAFYPEEYQARVHAEVYRAVLAEERVWGTFLWQMFDSAADYRREGDRFGINNKGLVSYDRETKKDAYWFYRTNWREDEPSLHLVGARMTETTDERVSVMAFSNVGTVTLLVNGVRVGTAEPDTVKTVLFERVPLKVGRNEIEICAGGLRRTARWERKLPALPTVSGPRRLTSGPKEHFLANYFAIDVWSPDNRYLLALETELNGRLPAAGERCTLGLIDTQAENAFIPVTTTACWNFQEAAMAHWIDGDTILFNDLRDGKFRTVVMNWRTKEERVLPLPVSAVSEDRTWAVSVNYARLSLTRPDYGYAGPGQDARETVEWPEDDGLWTMDLRTGETKLILSVAQGRQLMPPTRPEAGKPGQPLAYYCHTVISKDGEKIFFLARSVDWFDKVTQEKSMWLTTSFTVNRDGTDLRRCFKDGWAGSHFNWAPDGSHRMLVTAIWDGDRKPGDWWDHAWSLVEFTVGEEEKVRRIGTGILDQDWHCVYSPDGKFMSGETYWNRDFERPWVLVRLADGALMPVGSFFVPEAYRGGYWRCDLHARWRRDGRQLAFNSVHEGSRQVYVFDVKREGEE